MESRGVGKPVLEPQPSWEDPYPANGVQSRDQNRTRKIRPFGIVGRLVETWAMESANRARTAETPKQTSHPLRSYAPHFYPDIRTHGSVRGVAAGCRVRSCGTLETERQEQQRTQTLPTQHGHSTSTRLVSGADCFPPCAGAGFATVLAMTGVAEAACRIGLLRNRFLPRAGGATKMVTGLKTQY